MQKGTIIDFKHFKNIFNFILKNIIIISISLFFIGGILLGVFILENNQSLSQYANNYIDEFINLRFEASFLKIASQSFFEQIFSILPIFIAGTSMLGVVIVPFCSFLCGYKYGSIIGKLYYDYSLQGVAFNTVMILPWLLFFIFSFLIASCESVNFSLMLSKFTLPKTQHRNFSFDFKKYCYKYLLVCFLILISAIISGVISTSLFGSFTF